MYKRQVLGKPLHMPAMDYKTVCEPDAPITVKVEAPDLCPRYMAHYVRNIRMGESPRWMKRHLALCGPVSYTHLYDLNALIAEYDAQAAEAEHPIQ